MDSSIDREPMALKHKVGQQKQRPEPPASEYSQETDDEFTYKYIDPNDESLSLSENAKQYNL